MKIRNRTLLRTVEWGTPAATEREEERIPLKSTRCLRGERKSVIQEWSYFPTGGEFGEQGRMTDCIESLRCVSVIWNTKLNGSGLVPAQPDRSWNRMLHKIEVHKEIERIDFIF